MLLFEESTAATCWPLASRSEPLLASEFSLFGVLSLLSFFFNLRSPEPQVIGHCRYHSLIVVGYWLHFELPFVGYWLLSLVSKAFNPGFFITESATSNLLLINGNSAFFLAAFCNHPSHSFLLLIFDMRPLNEEFLLFRHSSCHRASNSRASETLQCAISIREMCKSRRQRNYSFCCYFRENSFF